MCLCVPAEIIELENEHALVNIGGIHKKISIALMNDLKIGEYVLVHVGHALARIEPEEAKKTLELFQEIILKESQGKK